MEPISTILITIGLKVTGAGKVVTAVKLAIAGKKLTAAAVVAKNALVQQAITNLADPSNYDPDVMGGDEPMSSISYLHPHEYSAIPAPIDRAFLNYLQDRFQDAPEQSAFAGDYTQSSFGMGLGLDLGNIVDKELLGKVKELYGSDYYISSIGTQQGEKVQGLLLPMDFDSWDQLGQQDYLNHTPPNPFQDLWDSIDQYSVADDNMFNDYLQAQEWNSTTSSLHFSADTPISEQSLSTSDADLTPTTRGDKLIKVIESEDLSDLEKDQKFGQHMATQFEAQSSDQSFQAEATPLESSINHQLNHYFKTNTIHFKGNDKLMKLVSHHSDWRELPADLAEMAKVIYPEMDEHKLSLGQVSQLMGLLFAVEFYQDKKGLAKMLEEQTRMMEALREKIEDFHARQEEDKEKGVEEDEKPIDIPKNKLLHYLEEGDTEGVIELLKKHVPKDHSLYSEVILLSSRMKELKRKNYSGLISNEEYKTEWNEISRDLLNLLSRLYN